VRVWSGVEDGQAVLRVANSGAQIAPDELIGVLEPFRRLESSRARVTGGYGLGLAVVRAVAEAHGGTVELHARDEGGLEVMVSLPLERDRRRIPTLVG
jgi:signal transduction histidine kinase